MKFLIICDYRENFRNHSTLSQAYVYNDHPNKKNINEIIVAIKDLGYDCEYFGGIPELIHAVDTNTSFKNCIFLNFTDGMDENYSRVQAPALLDILKVPYSGSGVFASALMNNKHFCKQALLKIPVSMPNSCIVNEFLPLDHKQFTDWEFPLFVKPNCEGSSIGITKQNVCHTKEEVYTKSKLLLEKFDEVIVEEFVSGVDVTNYLIGNKDTFLLNEVITSELFDKSLYAVYGTNEKQNKLRTLYLDDEMLPANIVNKIKKLSISIANTIGVQDICRVDYRVNIETGKINFIEINSAPRFSSTSEIGFIADKYGSTFSKMVQYYISTVLGRLT